MSRDATYLNNDAFRGLCHHCFWHDAAPRENRAFRSGDIVFCKIDEVWRLFRALRRTRKRIVLVTGEGFKPVTPELYRQKPPHVMHWFGTNMFASADDVTPIPLGIGNAAGGAALRPHDFSLPFNGEVPRNCLLYANFSPATNPEVRGPLAEWAAAQDWMTYRQHSGDVGKESYLRSLRSHRFVLCPPGAGEDTHRMWEALYCGAIPVVRRSPALRDFTDLPVLMVERLDCLTEPMLREISARWPPPQSSKEKLDLSYWRRAFRAARDKVLKKGALGFSGWAKAWIDEALRITRKG